MAEFFNPYRHGFARVAAATPIVRIGDPAHNLEGTVALMQQAAKEKAVLAVFPELGLTAYTLDDLEFLFIPEELGYRIARIENGREVDYGHLRQTTDDGYFVMTSMLNDHVSYGRFDDAGNFKALRLDEETDKVIEEHFLVKE